MHSYITYELYRERLAQFEREAELRRHLPRRERRGLRRFSGSIPRFRRRARLVAGAGAEAQPCR